LDKGTGGGAFELNVADTCHSETTLEGWPPSSHWMEDLFSKSVSTTLIIAGRSYHRAAVLPGQCHRARGLRAWAGPVHRGHAVVLSIIEKSQIQVLERMKRSKCVTMIRDYKRNGATTLLQCSECWKARSPAVAGCAIASRK
jgi:hypothetical protein